MKKGDRKTLVLLDAHAIIHRAYHALPDFSTASGEPTGALYGLSTMLMKIIADLSPDYIIACYDLPEKTFRHDAYDGYKAGRAKTDDALIRQLDRSREIFNAFHIPIYDMPGFEADDMLGTIVEEILSKKEYADMDVVIASGDMDTLQLVSGKRVRVYTLKKGITDTIIYDEEAVKTRYGFGPEHVADYKALRGDPSDNIIGIRGIGEKTATTLIQTYGAVEELYKKIKKDKEKLINKETGITERIFKLLQEGEDDAMFSKTLATIRRDAPITFVLPEPWQNSVESDKVEALFSKLEFRTLITRFRTLRGQSLALPAVTDDSVSVDPKLFRECQIALWLLDSERSQATLADIYAYTETKTIIDARDVLDKKIKENNLSYVFEQIELPIVPIIEEMEKHGVLLDVEYLKKLSEEYHAELDIIQKRIWQYAGEFNINSPKQLGVILFDTLGLTAKGLKKSAGGARSTRESELEKMRGVHPIIDDIFLYRERQKLLSTYIDTLPTLVGDDGRLHAKFFQDGTTTGRFSSQNPNLQNIPIKSELGKRIRTAFVAPEGSVLISFDYSQIELRVAALLSQDEYFVKTFRDNRDVHAAVAMKVFHVSEKDITHDMRRRAKVINFGILYGMGVTALTQNLGTTRAEAQAFHDAYFAEFPTIKAYLDGVLELAKKNGYTETLFGRKRYFKDLRSTLPFMRAMAERMAVNAPIQGTAADIMKIGMRQAYVVLVREKLADKVHLIMQIHDEIVCEVPVGLIDTVIPIIIRAMEDVIPGSYITGESVPIKVGVGQGKDYGLLK